MKKTIERIDAIDGLRAIAILGVLIFHTNFIMADGNLFLSGGFLGVDIFFVLSGYLITLISLKELQSGKFKILSFYKKRFIRILPLFIFVLATTVIASILILNFNEMTVFKDSFMSSILFYSNFFFYNLNSYWDILESQPLLHTWYLSLIAQYYLIIPLFLFITYKFFKKKLLTVTIIVFIISLLITIYYVPYNSKAAFYLLPFRFWEFLAGGIVAIIKLQYKIKISKKILEFISILGLLTIFTAFNFFKEEMLHPHWITLAVVLSTSFIIWSPSPKNIVTKLLSHRPLIYIGLISYSLYLWHFPLFSFAQISGYGLNLTEKILLIILAFIISIFSYYIMEKNSESNKKNILISLILIISTLIIMFFVTKENSNLINLSIEEINVLQMGELRNDSWKTVENNRDFTDEKKINVLLIGDSHSKDLFNAFYLNANLFKDYEFVKFEKDYKHINNYNPHKCDKQNDIKKEKVLDSDIFSQSEYIILASSHVLDASNECLIDFIEKIKQKNKKIILTTRKTLFDNALIKGNLFNNDFLNYQFEKFGLNSPEFNDIESTFFNSISNNLRNTEDYNKERYERMAVDHGLGLLDIDLISCDKKTKRCQILDEYGNRMYYDNHHWTLDGAKFIGKIIYERKLFEKAIQDLNFDIKD